MLMRKQVCFVLTVALLAGLAGCAKTEKEEKTPEGDSVSKVAADYNIGYAPENLYESLLVSEQGYYYYSGTENGFRYFDVQTGQDIFFCNKPECRHDGNAFCVATNEAYTVLGYCMYGEKIYAYVLEQTETQYLLKLVSIALDGSELSEVVTVYTMEKTEVAPAFQESELYAHRNKILLPISFTGQEGLQDVEFSGAVIVDLEKKEVVAVDEVMVSKDNVATTNVRAYGDFFYFCRKEGKKTLLYRYNITNGEKESYQLLVGFRGEYTVADENTVLYLTIGGQTLCIHHYLTGENEEKAIFKKPQDMWKDGEWVIYDEGNPRTYKAEDVLTDGTYIYVAEQCETYCESADSEEYMFRVNLHVFDMELNELTVVDMGKEYDTLLGRKEKTTSDIYCMTTNTDLCYLGEDIYWQTRVNGSSEVTVFRCKRENFIAGTPKFELAFRMNLERQRWPEQINVTGE